MMLNHVTSGDSQDAAVLLLHGFMGSANDWADVMGRLEDAYHSLAVDLPGHGASTGLADAAYTMDGAAQALVDLLDERGVERCAVVGYSMGGRLALYFAMRFPARCRKLVLESASPGLATAQQRLARRKVDEARAVRLETQDFEAFLNQWYRQPLFASLAPHKALTEQMIERRLANDPRELARSLRGMGTGGQPSLWERLSGWRVSTVAIAGARDPKYVEIARRMAALSPRMNAAVIPEAGHNVHAEQPRRFATLLHAFLEQP